MLQVNHRSYTIGNSYAKQQVLVHLNVEQRSFHITIEGYVIKQLPIQGL